MVGDVFYHGVAEWEVRTGECLCVEGWEGVSGNKSCCALGRVDATAAHSRWRWSLHVGPPFSRLARHRFTYHFNFNSNMQLSRQLLLLTIPVDAMYEMLCALPICLEGPENVGYSPPDDMHVAIVSL